MTPEDIEPISAPLLDLQDAWTEERNESVPFMPKSEEEQDFGHFDRASAHIEVTEQTMAEAKKVIQEAADRHLGEEPVRATANPQVYYQSVMVISNRYAFMHFYKVPAHVGMHNMAELIQTMQLEGCKLGDIQISFEVKEIRP